MAEKTNNQKRYNFAHAKMMAYSGSGEILVLSEIDAPHHGLFQQLLEVHPEGHVVLSEWMQDKELNWTQLTQTWVRAESIPALAARLERMKPRGGWPVKPPSEEC